MPTDPRLAALSAGGDPTARLHEQLVDQRRRIDALERVGNGVNVGAGPPTGPASDGVLYVDTTNARLYVRAAGAWRYAALT